MDAASVFAPDFSSRFTTEIATDPALVPTSDFQTACNADAALQSRLQLEVLSITNCAGNTVPWSSLPR